MQYKKSQSAAQAVFAVLTMFLLALAITAQPAHAQTFKVLHTFKGAPADGAIPWTQLTRDAGGNLYGTTEEGGNGKGVCVSFGGCGTAFKLDKTGKRVWLHSFNGKNGRGPMTGLLRDAAGHLFGTTVEGGDTNCNAPYGCGTAFKLNKMGKETVLHKFTGTPDGWF